jgi:hypothetical protein
MKLGFLFSVGLIVVSSMASAQNVKMFACKALDGNTPGWVGIGSGSTKEEAEKTFLDFVKEKFEVSTVSCSNMPREGTLADLSGKRWGFIGLKSNETYLIFQGNQVLYIQDCGTSKMIHKFNAEVVGPKSLKLSQAGVEGSCNPHYVPGFKDGSVISIQMWIQEDKPISFLLDDKRPGEETSYTSLYKEF